MYETKVYYNINGKKVPFEKLPCSKCEWRYSIHCPHCEWNKNCEYDTYCGEIIEENKNNIKGEN